MPIILTVKGLGHVPAMKNSKMIVTSKQGRTMLITKPERQKWMDQAIRALKSQLSYMYRTTVDGMPMDHSLQSLIAWSKQFDDSVQWIPKINISVSKCEKGNEGATITIQKL